VILNLNQLRSFYTAARMGSISRAAEQLMVTPPAVTMQVKQLEEAVGIRLLVREGNAVRLTHSGEELFKRAEKVFQGIRDMEGFLEDASRGKSGELRIGSPETPGQYLMPNLVAEFKKTYPGIKIILDQGTNAEMIKSIDDHRNELAVISHRTGRSRLKVKVIGRQEVILIASPSSQHLSGREVSVMQLSEVPLILMREGSAIREIVLEYLRRFKVNPSVTMESSSVSLLKKLVRRDSGVAFVERDAAREELKKGSLKVVRILEGSPVIEFGIGYRNRRDLSPAAWAFLRMLDTARDLKPFSR